MQEQIQEILRKENLSSSQFADKIGVQRSSVSHVLSGRNKPGFEFIKKIIEAFPELNSDWLFSGSGEMYRQIRPSETLLSINEMQTQVSSEKPAESPVNSPERTENSKEEIKPEVPPEKDIDRIVVFYKDKTFREYLADS